MVPKQYMPWASFSSFVPKGQEMHEMPQGGVGSFSYVFRSGRTAAFPLGIRGMYKPGFGSPILQREKHRLTETWVDGTLSQTHAEKLWNVAMCHLTSPYVAICPLCHRVGRNSTKHIPQTYSPPRTCVGSDCKSWWKWAGLSTSASRLRGFTKRVCTLYKDFTKQFRLHLTELSYTQNAHSISHLCKL